MTAADVLRLVVRRWPIVVAVTLVGVALGGLYAMRSAATYSATSSLIINPSPTSTRSDLESTNAYIQSRMETFRTLASTAKVLFPVREQLKMDAAGEDLSSMISVDVPTNSSVISITATSPDPARAEVVADAVLSSLGAAVKDVSPSQRSGEPVVDVLVVQKATDAVTKNERSLTTWLGLGGLAGLTAGVGVSRVLDVVRPPRRAALAKTAA